VFTHLAFGLRISSPIKLAGLIEVASGEAPDDVVVRYGTVAHEFEETGSQNRGFWSSGSEACYFYRKSGKYLVRGGREIIVDPVPEAPEMLVRLSLIGPALGLALIQRGLLLVHASTVAIDRSGVAFLGGHSWGKSTLAAALHGLGHRLVSDDLTAVDLREAREAVVLPSFPHMKLWPDTVSSLGQAAEQLPQLHPELEKRQLQVEERFEMAPVPLALLCVLSKGPEVELSRVEPELAVKELLRHWYGARFGPGIVESMDLSEHFLRCAQLAQQVPLVRLQRPPSENPTEPEFAKAIEAAVRRELRAIAPSASTRV
jgi:hypothetical protein